MIAALAALATCLLPAAAQAHGFDERYDLPAPLGFFVAGAGAAVALSLVVAALFARRAPAATADARPVYGVAVALGPLLVGRAAGYVRAVFGDCPLHPTAIGDVHPR